MTCMDHEQALAVLLISMVEVLDLSLMVSTRVTLLLAALLLAGCRLPVEPRVNVLAELDRHGL